MAWPQNVRKADLEISYYRGSGKGGQKRNKTSNAVRIRHIPTGIMVTSEETRSQKANRTLAFRRLATQLVPMMLAELRQDRPRQTIYEQVVRSYRETDQRVSDARLGGRFNYGDVLDGDGLGKIIDQLLRESPEGGAPSGSA